MPVTEPIGKSKFGWCLTRQHEICTKQNGDLKCHCKCHTKKEGQKKTRVKRKS